jgi:uncharacterized LabA/DUF88 family protein
MKVNVYIDGFNLYYGVVKDTKYKWLNVAQMCRLLLPNDQIQTIKYFTALLKARPKDPDQPRRQQTFLRALRTIPNLEIIEGTFLSHHIDMPLAPPNKGFARVVKTEEKGSDVNLATHLLVDGFRNRYELAVVVSNDSDLVLPIRTVMQELGKPVGVLAPVRHGHPSYELTRNATFFKKIRDTVLAKSQFASTLTDAQGSIHKPSSW